MRLIMNLLGNNEQTGGLTLLFDIRSGSVGTALMTQQEGKPAVHWSHREPVQFLQEHNTDQLLQMTKRALSSAVEEAQNEIANYHNDKNDNKTGVHSVECFFAAPWQVGSPQEITIEKESPFVVDTSRIKLAKEKARNLFLDDVADDFRASTGEMEVLSTAVLSVWCNGYRLQEPKDVETRSLRVSTYVSVVPERIERITRKQVSNNLNQQHINLHPFALSSHHAFTEAFSHPKTFLIINIDEEITRLSVINSGVFMGSVSFPLGGYFLTRTLAEALDVPPADARSRLRQYKKDEAADQVQGEIKNVVETARDRWQERLVSSLDNFSADVTIPEYVFVLANHDTGGLFADYTRNANVQKHILKGENFRVHEVTDSLFAAHTADTQNSVDHPDHYLSIAGLGVAHERENTVMPS